MKINWRQILIHFVAAFCLMVSFHILACFTNIELFEEVRYPKSPPVSNQGQILSDIVEFSATIYLVGSLGLLIGFIISLSISLKKKRGWSNSVFVFILIYLLAWLGAEQFIFKLLLSLFDTFKINARLEVLIIGLLLLALSFLLFFSKKSNKFIIEKKGI